MNSASGIVKGGEPLALSAEPLRGGANEEIEGPETGRDLLVS